MASELSKLFIVLGLKSDELSAGLGAAENKVKNSSNNMISSLNKISNVMLGVSAGIIAGFAGATFKFADTADKIQEMSQRTGVSTAAIQELGYAAKLSGSDMNGFESSIKKMQVSLYQATNTGKDTSGEMSILQKELESIGKSEVADKIAKISQEISRVDPKSKTAGERIRTLNEQIEKIKKDTVTSARIADIKDKMKALGDTSKEVPDAFMKLGLNLDQLKQKSPEDQFVTIASAIAEIKDPTDRAALAVSIFGRSGTNLLPILADGAGGLQRMRDEAKKLGLVMGDDTVKKGAELQDSLDKLKASFESLILKIGSSTEFQGLIENFTKIVANIGDWIIKNPELVKTILEVGIAIGIIGLALKGAAIAMAIFHAVSGPTGWAILAASVAIAAGAIGGIEEALKGTTPGGSTKPKGTPIYGDDGKITGYSKFASGGIVTQPTMAMIGEAGPEAVVPLSQMNTGDIVVRLYLDGAQIAEVIENRLGNRARLSGARNYV
jgi:hypothetical protein